MAETPKPPGASISLAQGSSIRSLFFARTGEVVVMASRKPGKPELTVIGPNDAPPAPPASPIESLEDAVLRGTQMDVLQQSLILSARIASDASALAAPRVAALKSIPALMAGIEAVKKSEAEADHEKAVPDDEQWDAEAY